MQEPRYRRSTVVAVGIALVLLATSPATAVTRDGRYRGSTSQDRPIRFVVDRGEIGDVRFSVFHEPCNLTVIVAGGATTFPIADDGTFVARFFASNGDTTVVLRGEFTSRDRVRGRFRSVQDARDCRDVARGTWRAHRVSVRAA